MTIGHDRRRFLRIAGTGAAASIAGCTDLALQSEEGDGDADERLTAVVEPEPEDVEELYDELEAGEIDRVEFQERAEELQREAIEEFERYADDEGVTLEESTTDQFGLYLIDGPDGAILDALRTRRATALYGAEAYDLIREQQAAQQQGPESAPEDEAADAENESTDGGADADDDGDEEETATDETDEADGAGDADDA